MMPHRCHFKYFKECERNQACSTIFPFFEEGAKSLTKLRNGQTTKEEVFDVLKEVMLSSWWTRRKKNSGTLVGPPSRMLNGGKIT